MLQFKFHATSDVFTVPHFKELVRRASSSKPLQGVEQVVHKYNDAEESMGLSAPPTPSLDGRAKTSASNLFTWQLDRDNVHRSIGASLIVARPVYDDEQEPNEVWPRRDCRLCLYSVV